jgi:hypothetical protein
MEEFYQVKLLLGVDNCQGVNNQYGAARFEIHEHVQFL